MKKLLGLLSALVMTATASSTVVACGEEMNNNWPDQDNQHINDSNLWWWGTRMKWNTPDADKKEGRITIYLNHEPHSNLVQIDPKIADIKIYRIAGANDDNYTGDDLMDATITSIGLSGNMISINISADNYENFISHKKDYCRLVIKWSTLGLESVKESAYRGFTHGTDISFGPVFKIPDETGAVN